MLGVRARLRTKEVYNLSKAYVKYLRDQIFEIRRSFEAKAMAYIEISI